MTFFNWGTDESGGNSVSKYIWIYVVLAVSSTLFTLATWFYLVIYRERSQARQGYGKPNMGDVEMVTFER